MPALFTPSATHRARQLLLAIAAVLVLVPLAAMAWVRSPWHTGIHSAITQPIPFSHQFHVGTLQVDCRYCHSGAEQSAAAGMPSTQQCAACHARVWLASREFTPVRASLATGQAIRWVRVNQLPDFVYFRHDVHVTHGVGCETCHGRVDRMSVVSQALPRTMAWCVNCHRNPGPQLRPDSLITAMGWQPGPHAEALTARLSAEYRIHRLTNCSTCHR